MKPLLHTELGKISDNSVHLLVQDLCEMFRWPVGDFQEYTFFNFMDLILTKDAKALSMAYIAQPRVLDQKLETLRDVGIYQICRELKNGDSSQVRGELTLYSFLKKHLASLRTPVKSPPMLSDADFDSELIRRRRANGSL